jgi:DNA polymerase (family X)
VATIRGDRREQAICARAAALVRSHGIVSEADLGRLLNEPARGIEPDILDRLRQIHESGSWVRLASAVADLPADLRWLHESGAVTLEQLATLHTSLGATSQADLAAAARSGELRNRTGLGPSVEQAIAKTLPTLRASTPRIPLGRAIAVVEPLLNRLRSIPHAYWAEPLGSLRRGQETVGDVELMASMPEPIPDPDELLALSGATAWLHRSERRFYFMADRVQVGIRFPEPDNAGAALLYLTGSEGHFAALQAHAAAAGYHLSAAGLQTRDGTFQPARFEEDIYAALGLPVIPPEIRNGDDEVVAASRGALPRLLVRDDIRGDLHMHSVWSDGRDTIEAMVRTCRSLGYEYIAITDHSPSSAASRNLTLDGIAGQADEIAALRERYPDIVILHGCEADILPDGRLDFADRVLERFDIVLASLHERAGQDNDQLMTRYVAAVRHPLVAMITHPTNRLVPSRAGYDLDYEQLFALAAETGTLVEIDGAPAHLDLDGALARRAVAAGAMLAVSSDCHRAELLDRQMGLGVLLARRGWVERRHVVNTQPVAELLTTIARKRTTR